MTHALLEQHKKWRDNLIYHLRMKDVPGDRIGDILLEAESHLQESGETPEEAFGDAKAYADSRVVTDPSDENDDSNVLVIALSAFAGSALYATGTMALGTRTDALFGLNAWIPFVLGAAILFIGLSRLPMDLVRHPVSDKPLVNDYPNFKLITAGVIVLIGVIFYLLGRVLA